MKKLISGLVVLFVVQVSIIVGGEISAARADVLVMLPVDQLIIKYKEDTNLTENESAMTDYKMQQLNTATGVDMTYFRSMSGKAHVLRLPGKIQINEAMQIAAKIAALPDVEYAEPDSIMLPDGKVADMPMAAPSDPMYGNQWHYAAPSAGNYGINAPGAWDISTGATGIYVAVLDTGIRNHADLAGRWQGGYDMISDIWTANDSTGRDSDPTDPGDWVASNACYSGSPSRNSSWHGTHVSGTIGAATNNGIGVAGINWVSKIIPVRVLGRCGGYTSDIADGIRWAAGLSVPGVPNNPYPAKVTKRPSTISRGVL
jgi:serine protease